VKGDESSESGRVSPGVFDFQQDSQNSSDAVRKVEVSRRANKLKRDGQSSAIKLLAPIALATLIHCSSRSILPM